MQLREYARTDDPCGGRRASAAAVGGGEGRMPNGICHGCGLPLNELLSAEGEQRMATRIKNMAPWPLGTVRVRLPHTRPHPCTRRHPCTRTLASRGRRRAQGKYGAIRHGDGEPNHRCNGVIWFYTDDPTPPGES